MTAPRRLAAYPEWMLRLASEFKRGRVEQFAATPEQYHRLRPQLYGLQRAIEHGTAEDRREFGEFLAARLEFRDGVLYIKHVEDLYPEPERKA